MSRTILSRVVALAVALGSALALAPIAAAQEDAAVTDFQQLVDRAMQHYGAREYEPAIALFEQAFAIRPEPELVYNIARSYERLARRDDAIREYERFVSLPGTTAELRSRALQSIAALREEARLEAASRAPAQPEPAPAPPPPATTEPPRETPRDGGGSSVVGTTGWVLFGLGSAAAVGGIVTGVLALDRNDAFESATRRSEQLSLQDEVRTYALITDILLIGGGVVAATGIVLAIIGASESGSSSGSGERASTTEPQVTVLASPEVAGVAVSGRF